MWNMICGKKTKFSFKLLLLILCISRTEIPRKINGKGLKRSLHLLSDIHIYIFCYFRAVKVDVKHCAWVKIQPCVSESEEDINQRPFRPLSYLSQPLTLKHQKQIQHQWERKRGSYRVIGDRKSKSEGVRELFLFITCVPGEEGDGCSKAHSRMILFRSAQAAA